MVLMKEKVNCSYAKVALTGANNFFSFNFQALGTYCQVQFFQNDFQTANTFKNIILKWVYEFERKYSRFLPTSLISQINNNAGVNWTEIDDELSSILDLCEWYYHMTGGLFDPTLLPVSNLWCFKKEHVILPTSDEIKKALYLTGFNKLKRDGPNVFLPEKGMGIDLGGIGKEYAIDKVADMAKEFGIEDFLIDFGHDIRVKGSPPEGGVWKVGIEDPKDSGLCLLGVGLQNRAIATSGNYIRKFIHQGITYGHIVHPKTGQPHALTAESVSVIAPICSLAGVLAKVAFLKDANDGINFIETHPQAEGIVFTNRSQFKTRRFKKYEI